MKVVAMMGSPLGMKGNTGPLLAGMIDGLKAAGAEVKLLEVGKLKIAPCNGCAKCHVTGKCVIKDDGDKVKQAMLDADGIVLASPNYINSVTAQMKAFFDRMSSPIHCQSFEGHYGTAVVTSGGLTSAQVEQYILGFLRNIGCWTVGSVGAAAFEITDPATRAKAVAAASALGGKLAAAIRDRETYPEQLQARQGMIERMKMLVTMHKNDWPHEYEYWKTQGRL